jgi:hypothetical protein
MKRRSARPFTVEIKHTRTSRTSLTEATARSRTGQDLWGDLPLVLADKSAEVRPAPMAQRESAQPKMPVRRVLPSLVPMFSMPVEPEAPDVRTAPNVERLPRVRRAKEMNKRKQKPAIKVTASAATAVKSTVQEPVTSAIAAPALGMAPPQTAQPMTTQVSAGRRTQQSPTLRPGERWKRRLPRVLW